MERESLFERMQSLERRVANRRRTMFLDGKAVAAALSGALQERPEAEADGEIGPGARVRQRSEPLRIQPIPPGGKTGEVTLPRGDRGVLRAVASRHGCSRSRSRAGWA